MPETFTDHDMRDQVTRTLGDEAGDYDVPAIVDELQAQHGTVDIETIAAPDYWTVVLRHRADAADRGETPADAGGIDAWFDSALRD